MSKAQGGDTITLDWQASERQAQATNCPAQFLMYGGAKGGGKSFWLCRWAVKKLGQFRGNKGFLGRKRSVDFNNTTLETFKKAIDSRLWKINEQKKKIYFPQFDGVIDYGGMDDQDTINKFNSAEYGFIGIDQAEEVSRDDFSMLRGTLRHKLKNGAEPDYQVRLTANPAQCWLKEDFIVNPLKGYQFIKALPTDNPFLAKDYIQNLKEAFKHRPELLQAYLYGSWDDLSGHDLVCQYSWVTDARDILNQGPVRKRVVVCDPAHFGDDETVIYVMEERSVAEIVDVEVVNHKSLMDTAGRLAAKRKQWNANLIGIDGIGIGAGIVDALMELGEPVLRIISSQKPTNEIMASKYFNLRSQIWFEGAKKIFEKKVRVPSDDTTLQGQLCCAKYEFISNGRMKVEAKEDIKKRLDRSPDRGDSFMMGLHTLELASPLNEAEEREVSEDRVGRGTVERTSHDYDYCASEQYDEVA